MLPHRALLHRQVTRIKVLKATERATVPVAMVHSMVPTEPALATATATMAPAMAPAMATVLAQPKAPRLPQLMAEQPTQKQAAPLMLARPLPMPPPSKATTTMSGPSRHTAPISTADGANRTISSTRTSSTTNSMLVRSVPMTTCGRKTTIIESTETTVPIAARPLHTKTSPRLLRASSCLQRSSTVATTLGTAPACIPTPRQESTGLVRMELATAQD